MDLVQRIMKFCSACGFNLGNNDVLHVALIKRIMKFCSACGFSAENNEVLFCMWI